MFLQNYKDKLEQLLLNRPGGPTSYADSLKKRFSAVDQLCVFGTGNMGATLPMRLLKYEIKVDYFCDNNPDKTGKLISGIQCLSLEELIKKKDTIMVLIATRYYKDIYNQLKKLSFPYLDRILDNKFMVDEYLNKVEINYLLKNIDFVLENLADETSCYIYVRLIEEWCRNEYKYGQLDDICSTPQYFDNQIITMDSDTILVDCGAYDGDTFRDYMKWSGGLLQKAYLFELSKSNYAKLEKNMRGYSGLKGKIIIENSGISNRAGKILYSENDEGTGIASDGNIVGNVVSLDEYFAEQDVTLIKMDIEGAEMDALVGAANLIRRCRPQLAICLYHKPEDLWEIPLFIMKNFDGYKYYIRHHTDLLNETVLYAVPM